MLKRRKQTEKEAGIGPLKNIFQPMKVLKTVQRKFVGIVSRSGMSIQKILAWRSVTGVAKEPAYKRLQRPHQ